MKLKVGFIYSLILAMLATLQVPTEKNFYSFKAPISPIELPPGSIIFPSQLYLPLVSKSIKPFELSNEFVKTNKATFSLGVTTSLTITSLYTNVAAIETFIAYSPSLISLVTYTTFLGNIAAKGTYGDSTGYLFYWFENVNNPLTTTTGLFSLAFSAVTTGSAPIKLSCFIGTPEGGSAGGGYELYKVCNISDTVTIK